MKKKYPKRSEVWLVNFDPTVGSEIQKTRPALIIQNNIANQYSPVTVVAAITSQYSEPLYPTEVLISKGHGGLKQSGVVLLNQIRTVDKQRLVKRMGAVTPDIVSQVDRALMVSLGLIEM